MWRLATIGMSCLALGGCVSDRETDTPRTATEELLVSSAADRAAAAIAQAMPTGRKLFLDTTNFDATDAKYAIGAIRDALLRNKNTLVAKNTDADVVVEIRSGALATNNHEELIGIPSISLPVPTGTFPLPKVALYDKAEQLGVAKFAATALDARTGALVASSTPRYGFAHESKFILLLFFGWEKNDLIPKAQRDRDFE